MKPPQHGRHGVLRGLTQTPANGPFNGRFTRLFPHLSAARHADADLVKLGAAMTAQFEATPTPETEADDEENTGIRAGYTYLGQFIDHDITFDPVSSLQRQNDPNALEDFRTPAFDLDNVYGRGPADQPYLYRNDGLHMLLGDSLTGADNDPNARGVPRNRPSPNEPARALLGDPRNDENVIVSQLQAAMLRFHNRVVDFTSAKEFEDAQRTVRFHYQWIVLNDFLKTIVGEETWKAVLPNLAKGTTIKQDPPQLKFFKTRTVGRADAGRIFGCCLSLRALDDPPDLPAQRAHPRFPIFSLKEKAWWASAISRTTGPSTGACSSISNPRRTRTWAPRVSSRRTRSTAR